MMSESGENLVLGVAVPKLPPYDTNPGYGSGDRRSWTAPAAWTEPGGAGFHLRRPSKLYHALFRPGRCEKPRITIRQGALDQASEETYVRVMRSPVRG